MGTVYLLTVGCLQLRPYFTGPDALVPRVIKPGVTSTSTVSEPGTAATAATDFPRFRDDPAFRAYGTDYRRRGCRYTTELIEKTYTKRLISHESTCHCFFKIQLTFTCLRALKPAVISVSVGGTSTILIPSTARSTATASA